MPRTRLHAGATDARSGLNGHAWMPSAARASGVGRRAVLWQRMSSCTVRSCPSSAAGTGTALHGNPEGEILDIEAYGVCSRVTLGCVW